MATSFLETVREEITCPLCLGIFRKPKKLPCDHVYCTECLEGLLARQRNVTCPECRTPLASRDVASFSTPYRINRFVEMYERGVQEATDGGAVPIARSASRDDHEQQPSMKQDAPSCKFHTSQASTLYCETCERLVCPDCVLVLCAKSGHAYTYVEDNFEEHRSRLEDKLYPLQQLHQRMTHTLKSMQDLEQDLAREEGRVVEELETSFKQLFDILKEERDIMERSIRGKFQEVRTQNSLEKQSLSKTCATLDTVVKTMSSAHLHETKAGFLSRVKAREQVIEETRQSAQDAECRHGSATTVPNIGLSVLDPGKLREACKESMYHFVRDAPCHLSCHFEANVKWEELSLNRPTSVTLRMEEGGVAWMRTHPPEVALLCTYSRERQSVEVTEKMPDAYTLTLRPKSRGRHELWIRHQGRGGAHFPGSPLQVYVILSPGIDLLQGPRCTLDTLRQPVGVKCMGGRVYVSELGKGVAVLEARTLRQISSVRMPEVWEVLVDPDAHRIYGTDNKHHRVRVMSMEGELLGEVGGKGAQPGQFYWPNGIRFSPVGGGAGHGGRGGREIVVCDTLNNRLQVLDKDLNLLRLIQHPTLATPDDLDFDHEGNMYVANQSSHTVAVFTPQGRFLRHIGRQGFQPGELSNPISVAVHKGLLYVTDCSNARISVFSTSGNFITTFGEGVLTRPECTAIDEDGYIYVSDGRQKLHVF